MSADAEDREARIRELALLLHEELEDTPYHFGLFLLDMEDNNVLSMSLAASVPKEHLAMAVSLWITSMIQEYQGRVQ